jgi:hypothetical protein
VRLFCFLLLCSESISFDCIENLMNKKILLLTILFVPILTFSQWTQKGIDIDGEGADDFSGVSVDCSSDGNTVAIGGYFNTGGGFASGHVRIYEWDGSAWIQKGSDIDGEAAGDNSGISVRMDSDGNTAVIGAYANDGNGTDSGHARVYEWDGSAWIQKGGDIDGELAGDFSGNSVDISGDGNSIIIGAYYNDNTAFHAGNARVFQWTGSAWVQKGLSLNGEAFGDNSGYNVSISTDGNVIAVGAIANDDTGVDAGEVTVYTWFGSAWIQKGVDLNGDTDGDQFGYCTSLSDNGNILGVGARRNDGNGTDAGHVKIYEWSGSAWIQKGTDIEGESTGDNSGTSLSLTADGSTVVIGAEKNAGGGLDAGQLRVYEWSGTAWIQKGNDIDGESTYTWFGVSSAISSSGNTIVGGGYGNDEAAADAGHVRVYNYCPNTLDPTVTVIGTTLTSNAAGYSYQWVDCDNGNAPIIGETSQSFTFSSYGNYAVEIDDGYCPIISNCTLIDGANIDNVLSGNIVSVFPNPTRGKLKIHFGAVLESVKVRIRSLDGKLIENYNYQSTESINLEITGSDGLYLIDIVNEVGESTILKVMKY